MSWIKRARIKKARTSLTILIFLFVLSLNSSIGTTYGDTQQQSWRVVYTLNHDTYIHQVAFSPDGRYLASAAWDGTIKLWKVATGREIRTFNGLETAYSVTFSPDGRLIASGSVGKAVVWEVTTGKKLYTVSGVTYAKAPITGTAFSPDGHYLATASWDKRVRIWEASTGRYIKTLQGHTDLVYAVAFSPDGQLLASASGDKTVILWEVSSGRAIKTLRGHTDQVHSVAFSPDGKWLVSGSWDYTVKLWDISSGKEVRTFRGHGNRVWQVAFSPDGKWVASASIDTTAKLWEAATGIELYTFEHTNDVRSVAFSPDGRYLATGSWDSTIKLWEAKPPNQPAIAHFHFSPTSPEVGQIVTFDATSSYDSDGVIERYQWSFGDGSTGSGKITSHTYNRSGRFTVTLTVTDDDGATDSTSKTITVTKANEPPRAEFTYSPERPLVGHSVTFDASASSDPDGSIVMYEWDFSDGTGKNYGMIVTHIFSKAGTYKVKLTVTDDDGATASVEQEVKVLESGGGGGPA